MRGINKFNKLNTMTRGFYLRSKKHLTRSQLTENINKMTLKQLKQYIHDRPEADRAVRDNLMNRCGFHSCHGVADCLKHIPTKTIIDEIDQVINSQSIRDHYNINNITFNIEKISIEASDEPDQK